MNAVHKLMRAILEDADAFPAALRTVLKDDLKVSVVDFAEASGIPQPTIYKLLSGEHEPNLRTVRLCVRAIMKLEGQRVGGFVAIVAPPATLSRLPLDRLKRDCASPLREYPAATVEDSIVSGVWAERDGALAIVAGALEAGYLRRAVTIDVHTADPNEALEAVVRRAADGARRREADPARAAAPTH
jgi:predicted transcriptional regulator